jgi:hypothetical protein
MRAEISPVGPFSSNTEGTVLQASQNESIDSRNPALFQYREALAAKRVERMLDLSPAQELTAFMCSLR